MTRSLRRRSLLLGALACVFALLGPVAAASASDNSMRVTLNFYGPKIKKDEKALTAGFAAYTQGHWIPLARALRHEVADLRALRAKLIPESPSTARGAQAKTDIVTGLRMIATAYSKLRHLVLVARGGPVSPGPVAALIRTGKRGQRELKAGLKLLAP